MRSGALCKVFRRARRELGRPTFSWHELDGSCRVDWMAVSDKRYYNARFLEASLIKGYQLDNGRCPPGQRRSCR